MTTPVLIALVAGSLIVGILIGIAFTLWAAFGSGDGSVYPW